jgi:hypothetical protein
MKQPIRLDDRAASLLSSASPWTKTSCLAALALFLPRQASSIFVLQSLAAHAGSFPLSSIVNRASENMPPSLRLISFIVFIVSATAAAIGLAYFAQDALELSRYAVRTDALITAAGIGGVMVLLSYSDRFGKK